MTLDLTADFLGLKLCSPLVVGACPLTLRSDTACELATCGVGALVLPSVFEEQIEYERFCGGISAPVSPEHYPVSLTFNEAMNTYNGGLSSYLDAIEAVRSAAQIPVVANMNGVGSGEWLSFGKRLQDAGADAIEVNLYRMPINPDEFADDIERDYLQGIQFLCHEVDVPVMVRLHPYFTSLANYVFRLAGAGAAGFALFEQFPGVQEAPGSVGNRIHWGLTDPGDLSLPLRWLTTIRSIVPKLSLAATGGAANGEHAMRLMQSGADVVMITSAVYRDGPQVVQRILEEIRTWASGHGIGRLQDIVGEVHQSKHTFPEAEERIAATHDIMAPNQPEDSQP